MDEMLGAAYLNNQFDLGQARGELNGWKKKAQRMSNEYSVLHRDWHYRGMAAIAWRRVAEDLYKNYYKKMVKSSNQVDLKIMVKNHLAETNEQYPYDPREAPAVR
jgi:hypothetical protein